MYNVATTCVAELACDPASERLKTFIGVAQWAGRGPELRQHLEKDVRGFSYEAETEKQFADEVGARLLRALVATWSHGNRNKLLSSVQ